MKKEADTESRATGQKARKLIYVRQRLDPWSSIKVPGFLGNEIPLSGDGVGSCGLLIAFPTKKAFKKQHPKEEPLIFSLCL